MTRFDRDGLEQGLRQLIPKLRTRGGRSGLRIVGGAALALRYFDRESTVDIDAHPIGDAKQVLAAGRAVSLENGWPDDWLNDLAAGFIPEYGATRVEWETIYDDGEVVIQVASAEAMLVMKLRANRPGRDDTDIAKLMALCGIASVSEAEELYESYYAGEVLPDRAIRMVTHILAVGIPAVPPRPPAADLG
ncbi:hypothetical protein DCE93_02780 [Agromyces badenianii]|uniref:DUF6036 domain-containing protein n=1 Tax=Agromyces badenianii TaxID=2080742 RepID=A0A2S0WTQ2_9MICO|nr:DUF6036 family nucleotidyltransferase [Agromyces badenianii]AWB94715.1 hypothetical protein DCE93_02780 [Agromyces badenianii]